MEDIRSFAQQVFASQPFSQFIGAELTAVGPDSAELTLAIQPHHKQQHGFAHGGVLSYLADNAITFAGGLALGGNALTAEFKINYLRPGLGTRLIARRRHAARASAWLSANARSSRWTANQPPDCARWLREPSFPPVELPRHRLPAGACPPGPADRPTPHARPAAAAGRRAFRPAPRRPG